MSAPAGTGARHRRRPPQGQGRVSGPRSGRSTGPSGPPSFRSEAYPPLAAGPLRTVPPNAAGATYPSGHASRLVRPHRRLHLPLRRGRRPVKAGCPAGRPHQAGPYSPKRRAGNGRPDIGGKPDGHCISSYRASAAMTCARMHRRSMSPALRINPGGRAGSIAAPGASTPPQAIPSR